MNILVTGSNGQLGSQFKELSGLYNKNTFVFASEDDLDITKAGLVEDFVRANRVECIINCASYTGVDGAEENLQSAMNVNALGVRNLAVAASKFNAFLVHYSTDYLYDGSNTVPYNETDVPNPQTVYGKSKLAGEKEMLLNLDKGLIIRTSWLYSNYGNNFVKNIFKKGEEKQHLKVVYDQVGTPTYAFDLATSTLKILPEAFEVNDRVGVYNYSNEGVASWYDIAVAIADLRELKCTVEPVLSNEFPSKAKRPQYSVLNKSKIKKDFNLQIPHWRHSLKECLKNMK